MRTLNNLFGMFILMVSLFVSCYKDMDIEYPKTNEVTNVDAYKENVYIINDGTKSSGMNDYGELVNIEKYDGLAPKINVNIKAICPIDMEYVYDVKSISITNVYNYGFYFYDDEFLMSDQSGSKIDIVKTDINGWSHKIIKNNETYETVLSILVFPQKVSNVKVIVEYDVYYRGSLISNEPVIMTLSDKWEMKMVYDYDINLPINGDTISYNPSIVEWE